jgi:DnaJ-class molecular chaperone
MIPYNGDPRYSVAGPTLDRCEGCHGIGVALVEKNGFCAHCNRLRLEFIVASARIRQRCSVCNGWGYQLVDPSTGMCNHCSRLKQSGKAPIGGVPALPTVGTASGLTQATAATPADQSLGDIEWDESDSDDDSDWDD